MPSPLRLEYEKRMAALEEKLRAHRDEADLDPALIELQARAGEFEEAEARFFRLAVKLAGRGWTMSAVIADNCLQQVAKASTREELDAVLSEQFGDANTPLWRELATSVLGDPALAYWRPLLVDAVASIEAGRHRVAIPALMATAEGALFLGAGGTTRLQKKIRWAVEELDKRVQSSRAKIVTAMEASLATWVRSVFDFRSFESADRPLLDRHWQLHGRDDPASWRAVDAFRLVNTLQTAALVALDIDLCEGCQLAKAGEPRPLEGTRGCEEPGCDLLVSDLRFKLCSDCARYGDKCARCGSPR